MKRHALTGWLLLAPSLLLLGGLVVFPILYNVWLSLFDKHAFMPVQRFVGAQHYLYFARDPEFWSSVQYGTIYAGSTLALQLLLGVGAALLLNDSYGLVNHWLVATGLAAAPVAWLGKDHIMTSLVITSVWQVFPFVVVTYLARLQTIAPELYEAAKVDGAGAWRRFRHVTLPQTRNVLFVIVLLRSIFMFTKFDTVWLMAGEGGVSRYVRTLPVYAYARSFTYLQAGMGAALAVLMFLMLLVVTAVYFRTLRDEEAVA